jgi:hypothetical protein
VVKTWLFFSPRHAPWRLSSGALGDHLRLWRLERNYRLAEEQLPRVLLHEDLDPQAIRVKRWPHISTLAGATAWLFNLPSGRVVAALSLDVACEIADVTDLLEDCYFCDVHVEEVLITQKIQRMVASLNGGAVYDEDLLPERHQLVFGDPPAPDEREEVVQHLVYRADLPYNKEHSVICYPDELNRRPGW